MPRPRKISQTQLAKQLGISQALVSLALNGRSAGINPDTYKRIWDHAVSVGYLPKGMRVDSTPDSTRVKQIGFILRARGRPIPARIAAALTITLILAFELLLPGPGSALFLTGVPLLLAIALLLMTFDRKPPT